MSKVVSVSRPFPISFLTIPNCPIHNQGPDWEEMGKKQDQGLSGHPCVGGLNASTVYVLIFECIKFREFSITD